MVGYPFIIKNNPTYRLPKDTKNIQYQVGNPMGLYSSWASFTLAHHFLVYWACCVAGVPFSSAPYAILGDDVVIGCDKVAKEYLVLLNLLGIEVSSTKTHRSEIGTFEFAKR